ncbi:type II toxin-antitoxin system HicB family antitoxin [Candidatus Uhrbacteria bacterium]|nr:type II toxin-antitoxin system HicB family antitoxin [Candidatus Uhrbacteria bacterium]
MNTRRQFPIVIEKDEEGYVASCPQLKGCYTQGDTYEDVLENIKDAIKLYCLELKDSGESIPEAVTVMLTTLDLEM